MRTHRLGLMPKSDRGRSVNSPDLSQICTTANMILAEFLHADDCHLLQFFNYSRNRRGVAFR